MGFFSYLFGTGSSSSYKLDNTEHQLSAYDIARLVTPVHIQSLDRAQEKLVQQAIEQRRLGDGKISLRQIDEILRRLQYQKKISEYDRKGVVKVFQEFFKNHF